MIEKMIFLYHSGSRTVGQAPATGSLGTGAWVSLVVFVLIFAGIIYWIKKKE